MSISLVVLLGSAAAWGTGIVRGKDPVVVDVRDRVPSGAGLSLTWTGDTMVGDASQQYARQFGYEWVFESVEQLIRGDVVIVNAEAPITLLDDPFNPNKDYSYRSDPEVAAALAQVGVHVLGLANNHSLDQGPIGLADTMTYAQDAGLAVFGAGKDDREAERPLIVRGPDVTVGVVALGKGYGTSVTAASGRAGTIPMSRASMRRGYELAKAAGADYVVAYVHWGANYRQVDENQEREARRFAEAGYDLVVGTGPHVMQPFGFVDGMPVVYSLGNFVFGAPGRFQAEHLGVGLILDTQFDDTGLKSLRLTCIAINNREVNYQPRICTPDESAPAFAMLGVPFTTEGSSALIDPGGAVEQ